MKKRAKPVGKKTGRKTAAAKSTTRSPAAKQPAVKPATSRTARPPRSSAVDRAVVEAARYTPGPVQSTGWPPFRYPPQ